MTSEADVEALREALEASRSALICDEHFSRKLDDAQIEGRSALARLSDLLQRYEAALRVALDCKGSFNGLVSELGGDPALCTKCAEIVCKALDSPATQETGE